MRESEFQARKAAAENREKAVENMDAEPGDAVTVRGADNELKTWLFLEVDRKGRAVLENWDETKRVSAARIEPKDPEA